MPGLFGNPSVEPYPAHHLPTANNVSFEDPPPPYTSYQESARPPSPRQCPNVDECEALRLRVDARDKAMPHSMFVLETRREHDKLHHQISGSLRSTRPQTLHFDPNLSCTENAQNNVRQYWLQEGIWDEAWGGAWCFPRLNPFDPSHRQVAPKPSPHGHWRHEDSGASNSDQPPDAQRNGEVEASRPPQQFENQVLREQRWLVHERICEDFLHTRRPERNPGVVWDPGVESAARHAIAQFWRENGIWQPQWGAYPGESWAHEVPDPSLENDPSCRQLHNVEDEAPVGGLGYLQRPGRATAAAGRRRDAATAFEEGSRRSQRAKNQEAKKPRRSQRIKDQEARKIRRSPRIQNQRASKPPQPRKKKAKQSRARRSTLPAPKKKKNKAKR